MLRHCAVGVEVAITPALDGEVVATFGLASMITVRVLVAVLPQVSVATQSMVSVATCDVSIRIFPERLPLMKVL